MLDDGRALVFWFTVLECVWVFQILSNLF